MVFRVYTQLVLAAAVAILSTNCNAFTSPTQFQCKSKSSIAMSMISNHYNEEVQDIVSSRRSILSSFLTTAVVGGASILSLPDNALAEAETMERGGVQLTPFNSLAFNYRGGDSPTVDGSTINEPSIPYSEFLEKLSKDEVTFVEFLAPNGDAAYATIKGDDGKDNKPIRIGEGYPIEDPLGWSSPAFVVKAVAKKSVPYKFTVPHLSDSFQ